jgi:hypothetical protein
MLTDSRQPAKGKKFFGWWTFRIKKYLNIFIYPL